MAKPSVATAKPAAAKAAPATKTEKQPSEKAGKRAEHFAKKIKVLFKENPGREGTKAHAARAAYKNGMTVKEYSEVEGADLGYVRFDVAKGFIELY